MLVALIVAGSLYAVLLHFHAVLGVALLHLLIVLARFDPSLD